MWDHWSSGVKVTFRLPVSIMYVTFMDIKKQIFPVPMKNIVEISGGCYLYQLLLNISRQTSMFFLENSIYEIFMNILGRNIL